MRPHSSAARGGYVALAALTALALAAGFWSSARFTFEPRIDLSGRWRDSVNASYGYIVEQSGVRVVATTTQYAWCTTDGVVLTEPDFGAPATNEAWRGILDGDMVHAALTTLCDPTQPAWEPTFIHMEIQVSGGGANLQARPELVHMIRLSGPRTALTY